MQMEMEMEMIVLAIHKKTHLVRRNGADKLRISHIMNKATHTFDSSTRVLDDVDISAFSFNIVNII